VCSWTAVVLGLDLLDVPERLAGLGSLRLALGLAAAGGVALVLFASTFLLLGGKERAALVRLCVRSRFRT